MVALDPRQGGHPGETYGMVFLLLCEIKGFHSAFHIHTLSTLGIPRPHALRPTHKRVHKCHHQIGMVDKFAQNHTLSQPLSYTPKQVQIPKWSPLFRICHVAYKAPIHMLNKQMEWHWGFFLTPLKVMESSSNKLHYPKFIQELKAYIVYNIEPIFFACLFHLLFM